MKICAVTMVYRDHWALSQWYAHYGAMLGHENLYIVSHGPDPDLPALCPNANILQVPRDTFAHFDNTRGRMLNNFQDGLNQYYDWVIRTDADELICIDPKLHATMADALAVVPSGAVFALGFDLFEFEGDPKMPVAAPALGVRRNAVFSGHYSKAWAVRNRIGLKRHGAKMRAKLVPGFDFEMPPGIFLAHLKYANGTALLDANTVRQQVANNSDLGLPGPAWKEADKTALRTIARAEELPLMDWEQAERTARAALEVPIRDINIGVVRAKSIKFPFRTLLPAWFAG